MYDLCIIGGGASGLACAITAKMHDPKLNIVLLEKNQQLGKKLLATGNGRCNITNEKCEEFREVLAFFEIIGVLAKLEEDGRFYPYSQEAKEVVKALAFQVETLGIECRTGFEVKDVKKEGHFIVSGEKETVEAKKLVIATGGKAGPEFGTVGDGYRWAKAFGHRVTKLAPALAPIECEGDFAPFKGVRQDARLSLYREGELVCQEEGNLQMTADGLSGICTFNLTRYLTVEEGEDVKEGLKKYQILVDFMPEMEDEQVAELFMERKAMRGAMAQHLFMSLLKEPVVSDIFKKSGICQDAPAKDLSEEDIEKLAKLTKNWPCQVTGVKGWKQAQVTKGGVASNEINGDTCESKLVKGLFFTGEVMDYDGPCGGFNLQHAWETGIRVGEYIAGV